MTEPDDLKVGQHYCVHSLKHNDEPSPIHGQSFLLQAIQLPYLVIKLTANGEVITIDTRYLNLMKVDKRFVKAQTDPKVLAQQKKHKQAVQGKV